VKLFVITIVMQIIILCLLIKIFFFFCRQPSDIGKTAVQYKSERRAGMEAEGFKILGNSGDQWSDLIGSPMATRSFKLPNPMYFIS